MSITKHPDPTDMAIDERPVDRWPEEPYKGLAYYAATDRVLFSGREADVDGCVRRLSAPDTRILLIHGRTGCGKSSFLRAGLIPELEEQGTSFLFLPGIDGLPIFIRCGADPLGRIAEQLHRFASEGVTLKTVRGPVHHDLSAARLGHADPTSFVEACRRHGVLKECLHTISKVLPCTLVVILDQAEEVITLSDPARPHRRQFFHFVKEFASVNFPVKFVIALRKDYSGQFVELAQMGGGIDLREREDERGGEVGVQVRSDVKLYLLGELSPSSVKEAILLPTDGADRPQQPGTAFARYRFRYAPGVAERIVKDLFSKSSTAVLPVMQIVCRELYKREATGPGAPPATIELDKYLEGGDISGPVDRHISNSLRACFPPALRADEANTEENRWREVLFRFVRLESDGTAHTRFVDEDEFREFAAAQHARTEVDHVVEHLTRTEVLLLRHVPSDTNASGLPGLSLGHDFLAMVLNRWKVARQATEAARERSAKLRKQVMWSTVAALFVGFLIVGAVYHAARLAGERKAYDVLLKAANSEQRSRPLVAMAVAAYAAKVADEISLGVLLPRDDRADRLLAGLMARMPPEDLAGESAGRDEAAALAAAASAFALPMARGFLTLVGDRVLIAAGGWNLSFDLEPFEDSSPRALHFARFQELPATVSEVDSETVLILRSWTGAASAFQLYVLRRNGDKLGPFGPDAFRDDVPWLRSRDGVVPDTAQVVLSGPAIAFQTLDGRSYGLRAFAFDAHRTQRPFRLSLKLEKEELETSSQFSGGIESPLLVDRFVVLPKLTPAGKGLSSLVKYDMLTSRQVASDVVSHESAGACPDGCSWQWISPPSLGIDPTMLVFAALVDRPAAPQRPASRTAHAGLDSFSALLLVEVPSGRESVIGKVDIDRALADCANRVPRPEVPPLPSSEGSGGGIFVTRSSRGPILVLASGHSADLLQVSSADRSIHCVGSLIFFGRLDRFAAAQDQTLLGAGPGARATWNLAEPLDARRDHLLKEGRLRDRACKAGINRAMPQVGAVTHLDLTTPSSKVCSPGAG